MYVHPDFPQNGRYPFGCHVSGWHFGRDAPCRRQVLSHSSKAKGPKKGLRKTTNKGKQWKQQLPRESTQRTQRNTHIIYIYRHVVTCNVYIYNYIYICENYLFHNMQSRSSCFVDVQQKCNSISIALDWKVGSFATGGPMDCTLSSASPWENNQYKLFICIGIAPLKPANCLDN